MAEAVSLLSQVARDGCLPCSWSKLKAALQSQTRHVVEELRRKNAIDPVRKSIQVDRESEKEGVSALRDKLAARTKARLDKQSEREYNLDTALRSTIITLEELAGPPFTIQRLAEVLTDGSSQSTAREVLETIDKLALVFTTVDNPTAKTRERLPLSQGKDGNEVIVEGDEQPSTADTTLDEDLADKLPENGGNGTESRANGQPTPLLGDNQTLLDTKPLGSFVSTEVDQAALVQAEQEGGMDTGEDSNDSIATSQGSDDGDGVMAMDVESGEQPAPKAAKTI
eukprot:TRINITY_DN17640_c0_g1_i1.p1 TRINITY_DN17640_c0_g1~~TRINITY_DN17640_c0_g1_i1.p1  ORF type:complete len:283 (+),score=64.39 TRINITY_DN17640_c0_g1_i1:123-971(+)